MEIIPAIDLLDGNCVRLNQGNYNAVTKFSNDPVKQALEWQGKGAKRLHLVDLDGAKTGLPINDVNVRNIISRLDIPIQLGGGVRTIERAEELINYGLDRVILGTTAIENPNLVQTLAKRYPGKIIVGIDAKNGKVATRGWIDQSNIFATDLAKSFKDSGIAAIINTDISKDGMLEGPNLETLKDMAKASSVPVIASGGVSSISDLIALLALESEGINAVIVGRALYDRTIDLEEALKAVEKGHIQDPSISKNYIA